MKESTLATKIMIGILCLGVAAYLAIYIIRGWGGELATTRAYTYSIDVGQEAQGILVRTEIPLAGGNGYVDQILPEGAKAAAREMMQRECGYSSVFRLSDPEETHLMLRLYNVDDTLLAPIMDKLGYKDMERCMFLGFTDGEKGFSKNVAKNIGRIARKFGAMPMTGYVTRSWEKGRFNDPYLRDTLMDFSVITDTLECTVNWSNMAQVHRDVRAVCHALPNTVVTTHMSHCYPQGANLYFIFITKMNDAAEFKRYHTTILDAIQRSGAAVSHHHGIGKMFAPWIEGYIGEREYGAIQALKNYFDPDFVMNPGGTIGLDLPQEEKKFLNTRKDYR